MQKKLANSPFLANLIKHTTLVLKFRKYNDQQVFSRILSRDPKGRMAAEALKITCCKTGSREVCLKCQCTWDVDDILD